MSDAPTDTHAELTDEGKRKLLAVALSTVVRLAKELPAADTSDPYANVNTPDPIGEVVDVTDHPAIHQAVESFKAAGAEVGIAEAAVNIDFSNYASLMASTATWYDYNFQLQIADTFTTDTQYGVATVSSTAGIGSTPVMEFDFFQIIRQIA